MLFDDTTPIAALTVADLKRLILELRNDAPAAPKKADNRRYVYGLQGIQDLFGCSHATAQRYKDTILKDAIIQNGRKIVIDVEMAMKLFNERRNEQ